MKNLVIGLVLFSLSFPARGEALQFQPHIQREDLAEEAIALLHCLSERSGSGWELSGALGAHGLELRETPEGTLRGFYRKNRTDKPVELKLGEAEKVCAQEYPAPTLEIAPQVATLDEDVEEEPTRKPWGWIALSVGIVGGLLLWKASRGGAAHDAIRMY